MIGLHCLGGPGFSSCSVKTLRHFCESEFHSIESKDFSKSWKMAAPDMFLCFVNAMVSDKSLIHSFINLPLMSITRLAWMNN